MSIGDKPIDLFSLSVQVGGKKGLGSGFEPLHPHLEDAKVATIYAQTIGDQERFLQEESRSDHIKSLSLRESITLRDPDGEDVNRHIQSAAKSAGFIREEAPKAAKEEIFTQPLLLEQRIGEDELKKINEYIKNNRAKHQAEAEDNLQGAVYIKASKSGLARGLQFNEDGSVYIHFNKKRLSDPHLGEGSYKRVRLAMNYDTKEICAVARLHRNVEGDADAEADIRREFGFLKKFKGNPGIAQAFECVRVDGKRAKTFFIQPLYAEGDLSHSIHATQSHTGALTERDQFKVALDLLEGGAALQKGKVIHRDIKPANVLVSKKEGVVNAYIADFGLALRNDTESNKKMYVAGTPAYLSPEYYQAYLTGDRDALAAATTYKGDAWALGCIIYEMRHRQFLREEIGAPYQEPSIPVASLEKDPLAWLEYDLLRLDHDKRLSAEEALEKYRPLLEQKLA